MKISRPKTSADRVIVAADFSLPKGDTTFRRYCIEDKIINLARSLKGTGVYIKVNSALRMYGYNLIDIVHSNGLRIFADLKFYDISQTLKTDGEFLYHFHPEIVTVSCHTETQAIRLLSDELTGSELSGVTVLSNTVMETYGEFLKKINAGTSSAISAGLKSVVCPAKYAKYVRSMYDVQSRVQMLDDVIINSTAVRPSWANIQNDDQNPDLIVTPKEAIKLGADRIVVGRPVVNSNDPRGAVMRIIEEVEEGLVSCDKRI